MPRQPAAHDQGERLTPRWLGWATLAGGTALMVAAIWVGASVETVPFNHWILAGLLGAAILAAAARMLRRASIASLRGRPVLALWLAVRFLVTPAVMLVGLGWLVCWGFGLRPQATLLNALALLAYWGAAAILATSALADLAAAIKGRAKAG